MNDVAARYRPVAIAFTDRVAPVPGERAQDPLAAWFRQSGAYGPEVAPPPGADEQTRLLCFTGRTP